MRQCPNRALWAGGFSLAELMTATAVATLLLLILAGVSTQVSRLLTIGLGKNQNRGSARTAINVMTRELRQAAISRHKTLPIGASTMTQSALQLLINPDDSVVGPLYKNRDAIFWQAPIANTTTGSDIAEVGYFVYRQQDSEGVRHSDLCRFFISSSDVTPKDFLIYTNPTSWLNPTLIANFIPTQANRFDGLFLENVIGMWAKVYGADGRPLSNQVAATGAFDSRTNPNSKGVDSLPPMIQISMVVMSSTAIKRLSQDIDVSGFNTSEECVTSLKNNAAVSSYWAGLLAATDEIYFNVMLENHSP